MIKKLLRKNICIRGLREFVSKYMFMRRSFGYVSDNVIITPPNVASNRKNIYIQENVSIDADSLMYATHAKITIKKGFVAARGLKIITGGHERRVGRFLFSITEKDKDLTKNLDKDVIINEDVWAGIDVLILGGVCIGRGCTLAARSVVTKSTLPYAIYGGVPAKFIKFYWTIDEIIEHESKLYPENERYTREQLEDIYNKYQKN